MILDNDCTHKRNEDWLIDLGRPVYFHYTPTSASWLNQIEIWFGMLSRKAPKPASFASTSDLKNAIEAFISRQINRLNPSNGDKEKLRRLRLKILSLIDEINHSLSFRPLKELTHL